MRQTIPAVELARELYHMDNKTAKMRREREKRAGGREKGRK